MATSFLKKRAFCAKHGINEHTFMTTLRTQGLLHQINTSSEFTDLGWKVKKTTFVPTVKALDKYIAKRAPKSKGASKGSSYEWNEAYLKKVFNINN